MLDMTSQPMTSQSTCLPAPSCSYLYYVVSAYALQWRDSHGGSKPPSGRQRERLVERGIDITDNMTREEASALLEEMAELDPPTTGQRDLLRRLQVCHGLRALAMHSCMQQCPRPAKPNLTQALWQLFEAYSDHVDTCIRSWRRMSTWARALCIFYWHGVALVLNFWCKFAYLLLAHMGLTSRPTMTTPCRCRSRSGRQRRQRRTPASPTS